VVRDQFQVATNRPADGRQTAEVPVIEKLSNTIASARVLPRSGRAGRVHLGKNPDSHLELGKTAFDQFQKKRVDTVTRRTPMWPKFAQQRRHPFLPGACPSRLPKQEPSGDN